MRKLKLIIGNLSKTIEIDSILFEQFKLISSKIEQDLDLDDKLGKEMDSIMVDEVMKFVTFRELLESGFFDFRICTNEVDLEADDTAEIGFILDRY